MSDNHFYNSQAREDFNKARSRATISGILSALTLEKQELLSLEDVKNLIKPKSETYIGMKTVDIKKIAGSEGRYNDFNRTFLPKREFIRDRWENVDKAHLQSIILPPIKLYQISEAYFVRDGNHRVSVARMQGAMSIDAEVIRLDTEISIRVGLTLAEIEKSIIQYEKQRVFTETELGKIISTDEIDFTATGRFHEVLRHIQGHKYFLNENRKKEIPFVKAGNSWYKNLYCPIIEIVRAEHILGRFPGRTEGDLYMWIIKHWDELKERNGEDFSLQDAAVHFSTKYGNSWFQQLLNILRKLFP